MSSVIIALTVAYIRRGVRIVRALGAGGARDRIRRGRAGRRRSGAAHHAAAHPAELRRPAAGASTFVFAYAMLAEAALSFLGVGIQPPTPSWGNIIAEGRDYPPRPGGSCCFRASPSASPHSASTCSATALRDVLDPRLKGGDDMTRHFSPSTTSRSSSAAIRGWMTAVDDVILDVDAKANARHRRQIRQRQERHRALDPAAAPARHHARCRAARSLISGRTCWR